MSASESWYIIRQPDGSCAIQPEQVVQEVDQQDASPPDSDSQSDSGDASRQQWGPFASQGEAIARRVGLIRAGKCKPV